MATKHTSAIKRPPIVTVLGHVDHGKTTLLDTIRNTHVQQSETGGITQHIGAYQIKQHKRLITFIDTPGHAAFKNMRARGGSVADIAILVIAADDGVQPQTIESIELIKQAQTPFLVAINKIDLPDADVQKIKTQLSQHSVLVEGFGGNTPVVEISAKKGTNIDKLLDILLLMADLEELSADPKAPFQATVIESSLDKKVGPTATIIVQTGTIKVGDPLNLPSSSKPGKIKAIFDYTGKSITSAGPSTPIKVLGFTTIPPVGTIISKSGANLKQSTTSTSAVDTQVQIPLIIKADTAGTLEAIQHSLPPEFHVIKAQTGTIGESDILLADTTNSSIYGFRVSITTAAKKMAKIEDISYKVFDSIYDILDDAQDKVDAAIELKNQPQPSASAKVLKIFDVGSSKIIGVKVVDGELKLGQNITVFRHQKPFGQSAITSLRIGNDDQTSVPQDSECGLLLKPSLDIAPNDVIIGFDS